MIINEKNTSKESPAVKLDKYMDPVIGIKPANQRDDHIPISNIKNINQLKNIKSKAIKYIYIYTQHPERHNEQKIIIEEKRSCRENLPTKCETQLQTATTL